MKYEQVYTVKRWNMNKYTLLKDEIWTSIHWQKMKYEQVYTVKRWNMNKYTLVKNEIWTSIHC